MGFRSTTEIVNKKKLTTKISKSFLGNETIILFLFVVLFGLGDLAIDKCP